MQEIAKKHWGLLWGHLALGRVLPVRAALRVFMSQTRKAEGVQALRCVLMNWGGGTPQTQQCHLPGELPAIESAPLPFPWFWSRCCQVGAESIRASMLSSTPCGGHRAAESWGKAVPFHWEASKSQSVVLPDGWSASGPQTPNTEEASKQWNKWIKAPRETVGTF